MTVASVIRTCLPALALSALVFNASAEESQLEPGDIAVEKLTFEKSDTTALNIARRMYGRRFNYVKAIRVWLEDPNEDPEQLFLKVGTGRNCDHECFNIALFYNEKWLEIYRRPATDNLGLTIVSPTGMKSIVEDGRIWVWNQTYYVPQPNGEGLTEREATEEELELVNKQLGGDIDSATATSFGPPDVLVYETTLKTGGEKIVVVDSPYYCGQTACPVFILNKLGQSFRKIYSLDGAIGVSKNTRDKFGFLGVETLTPEGVTVVSPSTGAILETIRHQPVAIAGTVD